MKKLIFLVLVFLLGFVGMAQADLNDGLVAYYPFNSNTLDESGNANDGIINGATLAYDRFGNANSAFNFDGVDDYIEINDTESFDLTNKFTLVGWIYPNSFSEYNNIFAKWGMGNGVEHRSYVLNIIDGKLGLRISIDGSHIENTTTFYTVGSTSLTLHTWIYVTGVYDGNFLNVYVNGVFDGSISLHKDAFIGDSAIRIGIDGWGNNPFDGSIDDIRIYNRALSESEIQQLYNSNDTPKE